MEINMEELAKRLIRNQYQEEPLEVLNLGGGFYGRVYRVKLSEHDRIVVKFHLQPNMAWKEKRQIEELSKVSRIKIPSIIGFHKADEEIPYDAILMEYVEGENAGCICPQKESLKMQVAEEVVDNLLAYHHTIHEEGFGEIDSSYYQKDWRDFYFERAKEIEKKAHQLYEEGQMNEKIIHCVEWAFENYWKIFCEPIEKASLIHGDYNMWNVMISKDWHVVAIIDPCGCCYGDSEYDLYQLNNANGKEYGLLKLYKAKEKVSPNCDVKMSFYEVFTEIMHYYDSKVPPYISLLEGQCNRLEEQMERFGILPDTARPSSIKK